MFRVGAKNCCGQEDKQKDMAASRRFFLHLFTRVEELKEITPELED